MKEEEGVQKVHIMYITGSWYIIKCELLYIFFSNMYYMVKDYKLLPTRNPNERARVKCRNCSKVEEHHAKGFCYKCYRKVGWVRKKIKCKSCGRERHHKAFGLCGGCHTRLHHYDRTLAFNAKRYHGIEDFEFYKEITAKCANCAFTKIVQIHHLDGNTKKKEKRYTGKSTVDKSKGKKIEKVV